MKASYIRADLKSWITTLQSTDLGTTGLFARQRVTESSTNGRTLVFEISADAPVVLNPEYVATETVTINKGKYVQIRATFATTTDASGRTANGTYYDCRNKAKLVITDTVGTIYWEC